MHALPTLYKARGLALKRPVCAICIDRTRGRTEEIRLGYRVTVWLCPGHASQAFQTKRSGRDFARTLMGVWQANGCMTAARPGCPPRRAPRAATPPTAGQLLNPGCFTPTLARRTPLAQPPSVTSQARQSII